MLRLARIEERIASQYRSQAQYEDKDATAIRYLALTETKFERDRADKEVKDKADKVAVHLAAYAREANENVDADQIAAIAQADKMDAEKTEKDVTNLEKDAAELEKEAAEPQKASASPKEEPQVAKKMPEPAATKKEKEIK
eukprot:gnl/TRDRNA2_/TRDRNA2_165194_c0_seq1.p1 gnl/TRDRNA2_/TRDRNA2_165194_c0~~gnl/TRDRNA2_/TRDRNA2_165194_c0_seq1.p1  ORF type:complete len:141 (+),score=51.47 gnl/TRDRNA2_/TRDRNA2_165194_c0_seq1:28-450(+)